MWTFILSAYEALGKPSRPIKEVWSTQPVTDLASLAKIGNCALYFIMGYLQGAGLHPVSYIWALIFCDDRAL